MSNSCWATLVASASSPSSLLEQSFWVYAASASDTLWPVTISLRPPVLFCCAGVVEDCGRLLVQLDHDLLLLLNRQADAISLSRQSRVVLAAAVQATLLFTINDPVCVVGMAALSVNVFAGGQLTPCV